MSCSLCRSKDTKMQKTNKLAETLNVELEAKFLPLCFPCLSIFNKISKQQMEVKKLTIELSKTFISLRDNVLRTEPKSNKNNNSPVTQQNVVELRDQIKLRTNEHLKEFETYQKELKLAAERAKMKDKLNVTLDMEAINKAREEEEAMQAEWVKKEKSEDDLDDEFD